MAGINRLGKAAPRPGSVRPVDPTRNRITDVMSETTEPLESDRDYQRAVQDIQDAQQTQGWLFGRGAFDKTDLLYLRDEEEKTRHTEMELHDREVLAYAQQRLKVEKQKPAGAASAAGLAAGGGLGVAKRIGKEKSRQPVKALLVKVSRPRGPPAAKPAAAQPAQPPETSGSAGLGDLLGAYGSGSDSEDDAGGAKSPAAKPAEAERPAAAAAPVAAVPPATAVASGRRQSRSRSRSPVAEQEEVDYGDGA